MLCSHPVPGLWGGSRDTIRRTRSSASRRRTLVGNIGMPPVDRVEGAPVDTDPQPLTTPNCSANDRFNSWIPSPRTDEMRPKGTPSREQYSWSLLTFARLAASIFEAATIWRLGRQGGPVERQFLLNRPYRNDGILRTEVGDVHQMEQDTAAFDVPQKLVAQTVTFVGALDQAGNVGNDAGPKIFPAKPYPDWASGCERVVGDLGRAEEITEIRVDFPALGSPTSPTSASTLSFQEEVPFPRPPGRLPTFWELDCGKWRRPHCRARPPPPLATRRLRPGWSRSNKKLAAWLSR